MIFNICMDNKEQKIIDLILRDNIFREEIIVDNGEDCSVLFPKQDKNLIITSDTRTSGTHFKEDIDPYKLGNISLASSLSDVAAMGGTPAFLIINLTLPDYNEEWIAKFSKGINYWCNKFSISIIGGDTSKGVLNIGCTIIAYASSLNSMLKSNAKTGDVIFVSGEIGNSYYHFLNNNYYLFEPKIELGKNLLNYANSCTDLSDGLIDGIKQISNKSDVGAKIFIDDIPINKEARSIIASNKIEIEDVLSFGDDYELLFTVPNKDIPALIKSCNSYGEPIKRIGEIISKNTIEWIKDSQSLDIDLNKTYKHF
tara:strand:- start:359 stop:1294 length:936 start_codon:yes stop_codon:yes gene_type:complete